jgi:hypothetical protein
VPFLARVGPIKGQADGRHSVELQVGEKLVLDVRPQLRSHRTGGITHRFRHRPFVSATRARRRLVPTQTRPVGRRCGSYPFDCGPAARQRSADPPFQPGAEQRRGGTDAGEHARHRRDDRALPAGCEYRDPCMAPRLPRKTGPSATTGRIALKASCTVAFNGTMRALSPVPRLMKAVPERGCTTRSDHVRLTSSSTRSPVFNSVVTIASAIGPARSASRRSR